MIERGGNSGGTPIESASLSDLILLFSTITGADEGYWNGDLMECSHNLFDCQGYRFFHHSRISMANEIGFTLLLKPPNSRSAHPELEVQHHDSECKITPAA